MELKLKRVDLRGDYTIGNFYIDGSYFCDTLEDTRRRLKSAEDKVWGKTAIPEGRYKVDITMSARFKKELPILLDVPFFEGIRIHAGNTSEDTHGCILVGKNTVKGKVSSSKFAMERLMPVLRSAISRGEEIWITIVIK